MSNGRIFDVKYANGDEENELWMSRGGVYWSTIKLIKNTGSPNLADPYRGFPTVTVTKKFLYERYVPWRSISSIGSKAESSVDENGKLFLTLNGTETELVIPFRLSQSLITEAMHRARSFLAEQT